MHLLRVDTVSLDEGEAAVDLGQEPGDLVVLSFTDGDLHGIAGAYRAETTETDLPSLRLAKLARLRHPMSVDLYVDAVIARARIVVIRCLGGLDYWRYGIERAFAAAKANGVKLAVLPGDDRPDERLAGFCTVPAGLVADLDAYFRAGGSDNLRRMLRRLAAETGWPLEAPPPRDLPRAFAWHPERGEIGLDTALAASEGRPLALLLVYRSTVLAGDGAPISALSTALDTRGIGSLTLAISSLKEADSVALVREAIARRRPDCVIAATAFSAREDAGFVLDEADCPVLQAYGIGASRAAWQASSRGMNAADLAMQVALPEFDGRLAGFPIAFKEEGETIDGFAERRAWPDPAGIAALADRAAAWIRLSAKPRAQRRLAMVLSDYPARGGRSGYAVGLDTWESARAIVSDLSEAGYATGSLPEGAGLVRALTKGEQGFAVTLAAYAAWFETLPAVLQDELVSRWGPAEADPVCKDDAFRFRMVEGDRAQRGGVGGTDLGSGAPRPSVGLADSHISALTQEAARSSSPRLRGEGSSVRPGTKSEAAAEGEGVVPDFPLPVSPPHPRSGFAFASGMDDEVHAGLSPQSGRGGSSAMPASLGSRTSAMREHASLAGKENEAKEIRTGRVAVFLQPDRGRAGDRKAGYHDPDEPPTHAYLAFHLGLRTRFDALIQLGTHGTTEWLPGKAVALSPDCWPARAIGALPVIYPFIVDDPGEAAPAKRRLGAVTLGHLTPELDVGGLSPEAAALRELVEEYSAASVMDPRRAELIARAILDEAASLGLLLGAGIDAHTPMPDALTSLDAHLCDLGETPFRDGLHVFGRVSGREPDRPSSHSPPHPEVPAPAGLEGDLQPVQRSLEPSFEARLRLAPQDESVGGNGPDSRAACAEAERLALIAALDGRFVPPGPSGSPSRGRQDVMPTGRNLTTLDPRSLPTRAATLLGAKAAEAVLRRYLQDEGEYPARIVMDLWASPTLRTGGEDVAHALALMGVKPIWDHASTRVTGFEVLPMALLDRPRIDVTCRVSGAFRDTFPDTLALLDQAARAVAAREEEDAENPLAAARRRGDSVARIYGAAPGRYGAGAGETALDGAWASRDDLGRAYLEASSHAFGRTEAADAGFAARVAQADAYVHAFDVAERDLLDGDAAADAMGGFAAAAAQAGAAPALYSLDVSKPEQPRPRTAREDVARLVGGRLAHPRWIAAQLRHGHRGAQELAQGIDALFILAATTDAVGDADLDRLHAAWIGDLDTFERLREANPEATRAILDRFDELRARGLWTSRRNAAPADALMSEAAE